MKLLGDESVSVSDLTIDDDQNFIQDLDLIVLGSGLDTYQSYTELLRKEYSHLNDKQYNTMRLKILETFLHVLPCIYSTTKFRDLFEETAKKNISTEVEQLKAKKL